MLVSLRLKKYSSLQSASANNPPLKVGDQGDGVAAIQELLRDLGYKFPVSFRSGTADGIYGSETKGNVEAYQRSAGLKADGILGRLTLTKLEALIVQNNILEDHSQADTIARDMKNRCRPANQRSCYVT